MVDEPLGDIVAMLEGIADNRAHLRRLVEQASTPGRGVIPFVGAGLSIPLGFPGWRDFLLQQARKGGVELEVTRALDEGAFEEAAGITERARGRRAFDDAIAETFGDEKLRGVSLSATALASIPHLALGPIVTTNYDRCIETAFRDAGIPFDHQFRVVWGGKADVGAAALHEGRSILLKLHGDWEDPDRILTRTEYRKHYGGDTADAIDWELPLPRLLELVCSNRPLLFLGCGLAGDRTLAALRRIAERHPGTAHYAFVEKPASEEAFHARARHLSQHNIRPIWYPAGRHDLVPVLLADLAKRIPPSLRRPAPAASSPAHRPEASPPRASPPSSPKAPRPPLDPTPIVVPRQSLATDPLLPRFPRPAPTAARPARRGILLSVLALASLALVLTGVWAWGAFDPPGGSPVTVVDVVVPSPPSVGNTTEIWVVVRNEASAEVTAHVELLVNRGWVDEWVTPVQPGQTVTLIFEFVPPAEGSYLIQLRQPSTGVMHEGPTLQVGPPDASSRGA